jgi:hypothetical protein
MTEHRFVESSAAFSHAGNIVMKMVVWFRIQPFEETAPLSVCDTLFSDHCYKQRAAEHASPFIATL